MDDAQKIWTEALATMLDGVAESDLKRFFLGQLKPLGLFNDMFLLVTNNDQIEPFVRANYWDEISAALQNAGGRRFTVQIVHNPPANEQSTQTAQPMPQAQPLPTMDTSFMSSQTGIGAGANAFGTALQDTNAQAATTPVQNSTAPTFTIPTFDPQSQTEQTQEQPDWMNTVVRMEDLPGRKQKNAEHVQGVPIRQAVPAANAGNESLFDKCTFESFVVGESNEFAHSAAVAVAEQPGNYANPLFIYGKSGLGKTHLMVSIANYVASVHPNMYVRYTTASDFMKTYISGLQNKNMETFDNMFLNTDVLLVDDVQYLEGKEETINQLFDIFNSMVSQNRQVVLTADRAPKDIKMDDRMRSRFMSGLLADVRPPDFETRLAIIKNRYKKAQEVSPFDSVIPDEVLDWVADNSSTNIREMEGAVMRLFANMNLTKKPTITIPEAQEVLQDFFPTRKGNTATIALIQQEAEHFFGVSHDDLIGPKRSKDIALARHVTIYLCRYLTEESLEAIGKKFGGRDHTTIMYSVNKIETEQQDNRVLYDQVISLTDRINESL